jgi:HEAT repeat protein
MLVFVRVVEGRVERVRVATDDCPIDGGGRRVLWLAVSPEASTDFLSSLAAPADPSSEAARRIATTSIMAIALHADDSADVALDALLGSTPTADARLAARGQAAQWTARARGRRGFERIVSLLQTERDAAYRRTLVAALAETRDPGTLPALLTIARSDADEQMRAEALFAFARLAPDDELPQVRTLLGSDASETVKRRGVRGLARRPAVASVPLLVALAESSADRVVRTEAVRALGQSRDPAATAFLARLLQ